MSQLILEAREMCTFGGLAFAELHLAMAMIGYGDWKCDKGVGLVQVSEWVVGGYGHEALFIYPV